MAVDTPQRMQPPRDMAIRRLRRHICRQHMTCSHHYRRVPSQPYLNQSDEGLPVGVTDMPESCWRCGLILDMDASVAAQMYGGGDTEFGDVACVHFLPVLEGWTVDEKIGWLRQGFDLPDSQLWETMVVHEGCEIC